jgi:tRNA-specific 2-thiouridylase
VVHGRENPCLYRNRLRARGLSWVAGHAPHCNWVYTAKIRYRQEDAPCHVSRCSDESCEIEFAEPQWAVAPGQSVVVYESRVCLGGGIIEQAA